MGDTGVRTGTLHGTLPSRGTLLHHARLGSIQAAPHPLQGIADLVAQLAVFLAGKLRGALAQPVGPLHQLLKILHHLGTARGLSPAPPLSLPDIFGSGPTPSPRCPDCRAQTQRPSIGSQHPTR